MDILLVLTIQIRREYRMDRAAVNMARISMTMIGLGVYVEEWDHEHPERRPHKEQHPKAR